MRLQKDIEVNSKQVAKKVKKHNKMKRWSYILGFELLNELMTKKRGTIIKNPENAQVFNHKNPRKERTCWCGC
ncbi:unnamed protein product [Moneuplotes crassus]|uniref:Uncharacterized protein n=1 Tax=Euplotes crassus TaxID=5936 RepID=A0AAD1XN05_EUPCR|nr:unnamed protein product [Moneuplotes crassus]